MLLKCYVKKDFMKIEEIEKESINNDVEVYFTNIKT